MATALDWAVSVIDDQAIDPLMRSKARALMFGYDAKWSTREYVTVTVEDVVTADLFNPETGARSRTFTVAGKLDVRSMLNGKTVVVDHKTTSEDITDPNSSYWRQLIIESQLSHYLLLEWLNGRKADYAMWDVIRKPSISPRQLTKAEQKEITFSKTWFGVALPESEIEQAIATGRETPFLYECRLIHDCTVERPERYFQRRTIPRLDSEIMEYAKELWDHSQDVITARRTGRMPRNSGACMVYGTPCVFLGVCSGYDDFDSDNWREREWVHNELPQISNGNGSEVLTNSRIKTWQTCRQKHKFQYELGIERVEEEDKDSLVFGDLMHKALAAWWQCYTFQQGESDNGDSSNNVPASEVGIV